MITTPYRLIICGGREYGSTQTPNGNLTPQALEEVLFFNTYMDAFVLEHGKPDMVFAGGAKGADALATKWAVKNSVNERSFPADWDRFKKAAGILRNGTMLTLLTAHRQYDRAVIAFPGGTGTADMVARSLKAGVKVFQIEHGRMPIW